MRLRLTFALALLASAMLQAEEADPAKKPEATPPAAADNGGDADTAQLKKEAKDYAATGTQAMKDADADPHRGVDAALAFSHAMHCYEKLNDVDAVCEMQANIFWCKKRMNL